MHSHVLHNGRSGAPAVTSPPGQKDRKSVPPLTGSEFVDERFDTPPLSPAEQELLGARSNHRWGDILSDVIFDPELDDREAGTNLGMLSYVLDQLPGFGCLTMCRFVGALDHGKRVRRALRYVAILQTKIWRAFHDHGLISTGAYEVLTGYSQTWSVALQSRKQRRWN